MIKAKNEAWKFYSKWRKLGSYCPALNQNVNVTRIGWNHLLIKNGKKRNINDTYRRFKLLKTARNIIESANHISEIRKVKNQTYISLSEIVNDREIIVILFVDKKNNVIFLSVMDR